MIKNLIKRLYQSQQWNEPFLSKRKLYPTLSDGKINTLSKILLDFLTYSDEPKDWKKYLKLKLELKVKKYLIF